MPQFNLRKWPRTNEEPPLLYKSWINREGWEGLWSPTVWMVFHVLGPALTGGLKWIGSSVGEAERIDRLRFLYRSRTTDDGSFCTIEPKWDPDEQFDNNAWIPIVTYTPPAGSGAQSPLQLSDPIPGTLLTPGVGREFILNKSYQIDNPPECWPPTSRLTTELIALDPHDHSVPDIDRLPEICPP